MARPANQQQQQQQVVAMLVALLVVIAAGTAPTTVSGAGAVTCAQVVRDLTPCISYAMGAAGASATAPGQACCDGIKSLNAAAGTTADRRATCNCLKQVTASMRALKPDLVAAIPGKCGVAIPYPISRTTDCSKVQ